MTLRLLKSLRITRRNTRPASEAGGVSLLNFVALQEARLLRRSRASALLGLVAFACLVSGRFVSAAEEPDPISKLGQRSALQRWKEARSEWTDRRERRQQIR